MAQFPSPDRPLKQPQAVSAFKVLGPSPLPLFLKKAKGVHLYDCDGNKFLDFSMQGGEVVFGHGNEACTKYAKNAISAGLSSAGAHPKDSLRALRLWQKRLHSPLALYNSLLEAFIYLAKVRGIKSFSYSNGYIKNLLAPLEGIMPITAEGGFRLYEPALGEGGDLALHSRFFYRGNSTSAPLNILHASPFGGKDCALIYGEHLPSAPQLSFENSALLAEGAKFKPLPYADFAHPLAESRGGYALLKKEISLQKALEAGLVIEGDILFFSPLHTPHDMKRLKKFLDSQLD